MRKRGISLVEMVVYVALMAVIFTVVINSIVAIMQSYRTIKATKEIENSAIVGVDRMIREIRNATSVDTANSTLNSSPGVLTILTQNASGTTISRKFYVSGGRLSLDEAGVYSGPLTISSVTVSNLIFNTITTGNSTGVRVRMTLQTPVGSSTKTESFYDTAILRGSY